MNRINLTLEIKHDWTTKNLGVIDRRKFRSQTSDNIWTEERRSEKRKREKKEDARAPNARKVAKPCVLSNDLWLRRVEK